VALNESRESERRHDYTALVRVVTETLSMLKSRDGDATLNAQLLQAVVDTTSEIKEQLMKVNGRVRENEKSISAIEATPPLTREYCEAHRGVIDKAVRELQQKTPAIIQLFAVSVATGSTIAVLGYLLSRL